MAIIDNLVAYWSLDEAAGANNAIDAHADLDLTQVHSPGSAAGAVGTSRTFDGSNDYFTRDDDASLSTGDIDFTISAWVYLTNTTANYTIISRWVSTGNQREYALFYNNNDHVTNKRFSFIVSASGTAVSATADANNFGEPSATTWYHVVAWHDSVNNLIGISVNAGTPNTTSHSGGVLDSTSVTHLGRLLLTWYPMNGSIDEVGFWKRVLTSDERTWLYNAGSGHSYADIVAGMGTTYEDSLSLSFIRTVTSESIKSIEDVFSLSISEELSAASLGIIEDSVTLPISKGLLDTVVGSFDVTVNLSKQENISLSSSLGTIESSNISIANPAATELTDYPVRVNLTSIAGMNEGLNNIRFKDGASTLYHWIESAITGTSSIVWVKIPTLPASGMNITMEWGDVLQNTSNGDNTFSLYDNFDTPLMVQANNATSASITGSYFAENIVFDDVTNKYWWILQDSTSSPYVIRLAYSDSITSPSWTLETDPVITGSGTSVQAPHIAKFGSTWYIYYGLSDGSGGIYCQSSSTVNSGYSESGITNPQIYKVVATWEANRTHEPYVFQVGSTYYMFYMGGDVAGSGELEKVGYATASSPIGPWTKYASNPVLSGDTGWWDTGNDKAADPWVIEKDGVYYIGVAGCVTAKTNWYTGIYTTSDFITFTPLSSNPLLLHPPAPSVDGTNSFRGAVSLFGGVYYFAYTAGGAGMVGGIALTTINFNVVEINFSRWHERLSVDQGTGVVTLNAAGDYLESTTTFGQGYAIRSYSKFASSSTTGYIGFRDKSDGSSDYLEIIANYPSTNTKGYQNVSGDSGTANMGVPGAYHVYEIQRNANTNGRYLIDDGTASELATQLPTGSLPITLAQVVEVDWALVRKYIYPEPASTVGSTLYNDTLSLVLSKALNSSGYVVIEGIIDLTIGRGILVVSAVGITVGSTVWGHITGVTEDNARTFADNWTGTGAISGLYDEEKACLDSGEILDSEVVQTGVVLVTLLYDTYGTGTFEGTLLLQYRHGNSVANCELASWNAYTVPFMSDGYVQIRIEAP